MKKKHISSTKKKTGSILRNMTRIPLLFYKRLSLYSRCDTIPLSHFIDCVCDNNIKRLKRKKYLPVPDKWLEETWEIIIEEYTKKTDGNKYNATIGTTKDIYRDVCRLLTIDTCINALSEQYSPLAADILRKMGYRYSFNPEEGEKYIKELENVRNKVKIIAVSLESNKKKYDKLSIKHKKTGNERDEFINTLTILSKHQGYRINPEVTTVSEYLNILENYKKETEKILKQYGNRKNK